jgi:FixJ family two-component response regulator
MSDKSCSGQPGTADGGHASRRPQPLVAVVEDDPSMRRSLQRLLAAHGFAVETFASAEAFLGDLPVCRSACALFDIDLPGMSGLELHHRINAAGATLPVIFITALDDDVLEQAAIGSGCVAYIRKPFAAERLITAIENALGR